jgi:hypothetical protein
MLAISMEDFVTNLVDWLPQKLQHPVEIVIYMVFLSVLMLVPFALWLGYAISSARSGRPSVPQAPPSS